jgi:hypothetical protein
MAAVLRITQHRGSGPDRHHAMLTLTDAGWAPRLVTVEFSFALSPQDREDIRWYLEDYLEFAEDPAPRIAARVERRMGGIRGFDPDNDPVTQTDFLRRVTLQLETQGKDKKGKPLVNKKGEPIMVRHKKWRITMAPVALLMVARMALIRVTSYILYSGLAP